MNEIRDAQIHHLIGGALCLDFANTLYGHDDPVHEYLYDYRDLVLWSRHAGILSAERTAILLSKGEQAPAESEALFRLTQQLRERLYRIFSSLACQRSPAEQDLADLHGSWSENQRYTRLVPAGETFELDWQMEPALESLLWPLVNSAVELLISQDLPRLKQCDRCDWLFLDRSRNRRRRWCSMDACGNRVKMARRYERSKKT